MARVEAEAATGRVHAAKKAPKKPCAGQRGGVRRIPTHDTDRAQGDAGERQPQRPCVNSR